MTAEIRYDVVIPTLGRPSLARLLAALGACGQPLPRHVVVVDDRQPDDAVCPLELTGISWLDGRLAVLQTGGRGPATARNAGWRVADAPWIAFLDDDVEPADDWTARLLVDLAAATARTAGVQGRIAVPLPRDRPATDWERNVAGLERASWATADLAYRRSALLEVGGFDERFGRNYREDADLALRLLDAGWELAVGSRSVVHPVGPARASASVRAQAGNADDVMMDALHGRGWRNRANAPQGRLRRHLVVATAGLAAAAAAASGRRRAAALAGAAWLAGTAELTAARIAPGPRTPAEIATMVATSAAIPFAAAFHRLRGHARVRALRRDGRPANRDRIAVLLDRDGTLIVDVPYNGDPSKVVPLPTAREAIAVLRRAGVATAVVSNQSGIGRGLLSRRQVDAVNERVEALLGPLGPWLLCPHAPEDGCSCRKPEGGLVLEAARMLGVPPNRCVMIGDIGADVAAAGAAGARAVLVPTTATRADEIDAAAEVAPDLVSAVRLAIGTAR